MRNQCSLRLSVILGRVRAKALYMYDFGNSWEQTIGVEEILPPDSGVLYLLCVCGPAASRASSWVSEGCALPMRDGGGRVPNNVCNGTQHPG